MSDETERMKPIYIESDGTELGTKALFPDGRQIAGVCSYSFSKIDNNAARLVTLECELIGVASPDRQYLRLEIETFFNGGQPKVRVLSPGGEELLAKEIQAVISAREIPKATITFYVAPRKAEARDYATPARDKSKDEPTPLSAIQFVQLRQIARRPICDGDLVSKEARDGLYRIAYIDRMLGWNFLTPAGVGFCHKHNLFG